MVPFHRENFASEMKPFLSGNNLTLEYENIESSLAKVIVDISRLLGTVVHVLTQKFHDDILSAHERQAVEYLQRSVLHFTMYEHLIFLITRVGNDGVTVKKNDDETTIYKYQQDNLENKYISLGWFWCNQLIQYMNDNLDEFPGWRDSDGKKNLDELPISLSDFEKWVGVVDGQYFIITVAWIIREVWTDCVLSRSAEPQKNDAIARAVCYEVMGRACTRLAYSCLPEPIRKDIDNEMGKNHRAEADKVIREKISNIFLQKACVYWTDLDLLTKQQNIAASKATVGSHPVLGNRQIRESDSFFYS
jgi:hypothetical protein